MEMIRNALRLAGNNSQWQQPSMMPTSAANLWQQRGTFGNGYDWQCNPNNMSSPSVTPMIPTHNRSYIDLMSFSHAAGLKTVPELPSVREQNNHILHNPRSHLPGLEQKSFGFFDGPLNNALGMMMMMSSNSQLVDEPDTSAIHSNSTLKPLHQQMQGDGYGMDIAETFGTGNIYEDITYDGSTINSHTASFRSDGNLHCAPNVSGMGNAETFGTGNIYEDITYVGSTMNSHTASFRSDGNLHCAPNASHLKPLLIDQSENINSQSPFFSTDNLLQSHQQQQFQQQPHQFHQQCFQHQHLQKQQNQSLLNNDACGQSQQFSDRVNNVKNEPRMEQQNEESQTSQPMQQILHPHQFAEQSQNNFNCLSVGAQSESAQHAQSYHLAQCKSILKPLHHIMEGKGYGMDNAKTSEDRQPSPKRMKIAKPSQSLAPKSENVVKKRARPNPDSRLVISLGESCKSYDSVDASGVTISKSSSVVEISEDIQPFVKRMKIDQPSATVPHVSQDVQHQDYQHSKMGMPIKSKFQEVEIEVLEQKEENAAQPAENAVGTNSQKPKVKGVSLTELITPEQVREHILGLRQGVGQGKAKAEKNQAMEHSMSKNSCQLCAAENLTFEPLPLYCTPCGVRIKPNATCYAAKVNDAQHYFCMACYKRKNTYVDGISIPKEKLCKKEHDKGTEEQWVQCDKCDAWQHQICALFNGRRNVDGEAQYTCPNCYIREVESGKCTPLPQSAVPGAKDLPRTTLSDHIEERLFKKLEHERQERAKLHRKSYDEVPGAEGLVVRVVSSVDKKLEVKKEILELFQEDNYYPIELPYKSKAILLFQKIEGVDVCIFGMFVHEYGSECPNPNHRRVYLSYLDSVKYFRPEVKTVTGEALRSFVYHEVLIGYLDYCKLRGFTSCYIWACPPSKGDDYILYCHPETQRTPKSDILREWYLAMLRKAAKEDIVVDLTNLYDHFFVSGVECRAKVTAARLPYFDGDYWPGVAENLIYQIREEEDRKRCKREGPTKKTITKTSLKASCKTDLFGNASKDTLLMLKLGEIISQKKHDYIMVHLQHACSHCCNLMVSGSRFVCKKCNKFQLCYKCFEAEKKRGDKERHPANNNVVHRFKKVSITDVAADTTDKDEILRSELFDTRQAFLSFCQGNHYQYDTLRRAKHSSMMVLYHLHNPTAPAFASICNVCERDIKAGQEWRCEVCPDYDLCTQCYEDGGSSHPHKLTNHSFVAARNEETQAAELRKMLDLLVHAAQCGGSNQCQYLDCRKIKWLFKHGKSCKNGVSKGCSFCKRMWYLLKLHAQRCKESVCRVPRCSDIKENLKGLHQHSDSSRGDVVMETMRLRSTSRDDPGG